MDELEFAWDGEDIRRSLISFNNEAKDYQDRGRVLARQTTYWVYDFRHDAFGPNKFVAYRNMTFGRYENALQGNFCGVPFDGHAARRVIERTLGQYEYDNHLRGRLSEWAESLFFVGIFDGISEHKWKFTSLP